MGEQPVAVTGEGRERGEPRQVLGGEPGLVAGRPPLIAQLVLNACSWPPASRTGRSAKRCMPRASTSWLPIRAPTPATGPRRLALQPHDEVDDPDAVGAAVDVVPQDPQRRRRRRTSPGGVDQPGRAQRVDQVVPVPVHVTDHKAHDRRSPPRWLTGPACASAPDL